MPKGPHGELRPADTNTCAVLVGRIATGEVEDACSAPSGRSRSGMAGAEARAKKLTKEQRTKIAQTAAAARWK